MQDWLPALEGVVEKLNRGATVADVGCGHGASTILMAKAFPKSKFIGFDYHLASVHRAEQAARDAGVAANCRFEVATAKDYPGNTFDLVACLRLPARHGRSGRRGEARVSIAQARWHVDDRRTVRQRCDRAII